MSIMEPNQIDAAVIDSENNMLVLLLADSHTWLGREVEHIKRIQEKLKNYLFYYESGQYQNTYKNKNFSGLRIEIQCKYQPPESFYEYLNYHNEKLENKNIKITCEKIDLEEKI